MVVPALIYVAWNLGNEAPCAAGRSPPPPTSRSRVAVLAVISTHLPSGLRTFLLTLAVVDDLLAITVIALFYTEELHPRYLLLAAAARSRCFGALVQRAESARRTC